MRREVEHQLLACGQFRASNSDIGAIVMEEENMTEKQDMGPNFELARKREIKEGNFGLPQGAIKCTDAEIVGMLQKIHIEEIRFYNDTNHCINGGLFALKGYEAEESDFENQIFNGQLDPEVEGYRWYRGLAIRVGDAGRIFIFAGAMQPWREGGSPDCIVYSRGRVTREEIFKVVRAYCDGILSYMTKQRFEMKKRMAKFEAEEAYKKAKEKGSNNMDALNVYNETYDAGMKNK